jgi:hypothetical protein
MDIITLDRVIRNGHVAVLYSPGYGAGWSTWAHNDEGKDLLFDPVIVGYVERGAKDELATYMEMRYPDVYTGGMDDLVIEWVPIGTMFKINEYDGSESIEFKEADQWMVA